MTEAYESLALFCTMQPITQPLTITVPNSLAQTNLQQTTKFDCRYNT